MRLVVWNIRQGGAKRIPGIARALEEIDADVCVLSEYTSRSGGELKRALDERGYRHVAHTEPEASWGGLLVAARTPLVGVLAPDCPSPERWLHVTGEGLPFEIGAAYIPNAERSSTAKRDFWDWLLASSRELLGRPVVICGDLNTALPYVDEDGSTIPCADAMADLARAGWSDLWRAHHGDSRASSWWSNLGNGFRLDHAFGTSEVRERCTGAYYATSVGDQCIAHPERRHDGCEKSPLSDHSMLVIDFRDP